jgi:hypothetical protein
MEFTMVYCSGGGFAFHSAAGLTSFSQFIKFTMVYVSITVVVNAAPKPKLL